MARHVLGGNKQGLDQQRRMPVAHGDRLPTVPLHACSAGPQPLLLYAPRWFEKRQADCCWQLALVHQHDSFLSPCLMLCSCLQCARDIYKDQSRPAALSSKRPLPASPKSLAGGPPCCSGVFHRPLSSIKSSLYVAHPCITWNNMTSLSVLQSTDLPEFACQGHNR